MVSLGGDVDDDLGGMMIMTIMAMIIENLHFATWVDWVLFRLEFGLKGVGSEACSVLDMISKFDFTRKSPSG
jgi:hypothetical protein